ncbi:MAG: SCP2 sterol-binding domain-containing protein [Methyloprofundus sp.]|nr:SCP2 sterol-binding domain-containing protein [Methyloprofundus sp.]
MTIKPLVMSALETALNKYLSLDEDVSMFLKPLSGKVIAITITPIGETLYLSPSETIIQFMDFYEHKPDTTITGSLPALGLMGLSNTPARSFFSGDVEITGDLAVGQQFQQLFKQLDIDLEEQLSQYTGDVVAHKLGNLFKSAHQFHQESITSIKLNVAEFLQDESKDLPPEPEINIFTQQVDQLKEELERAEAKIQRLDDAVKAAQQSD